MAELRAYTVVATYSVPYAESEKDALYQFNSGDGQCHLEKTKCHPTDECQCGDTDKCADCFSRRPR